MFSPRLIWNHRIRLTTLLTLTVSLTIGIVFLFIAIFVRNQSLERRSDQLQLGVRAIANEWAKEATLDDDFPDVVSAVYDVNDHLLAASDKVSPPPQLGLSLSAAKATFGLHSGKFTVVGTTSITETRASIKQLYWILALLWLPLTLLAAAASWYGGGLVLRPIKELVTSAERLSAQADNQLLTTSDRAEFAALANSLNQLISRVRRSAQLQEQFAADAAHELRNPLAKLQMRIETNLRRDRSVQEHVESQKAMLAQIEHLTSIVETLLASARSVKGDSDVIRLDCALNKAVANWITLRDFPPSRVKLSSVECFAEIDEDELSIIIANLLDNSAHHSPPDREIIVELSARESIPRISVQDFGKGLTPKEADHAFDRFYRSDEARNRNDGGLGIGLSVVKRIIESRNGTVQFENVSDGAMVALTLPPAKQAFASSKM